VTIKDSPYVSRNFDDSGRPRIRWPHAAIGRTKISRFAEMGAPAGFWDNTALS
jgi:hypothetical protein